MSTFTVRWFTFLFAVAATTGLVSLTGCGVDLESAVAPATASEALPKINGHVHGGAYPIQQGLVQLWETGVTGTRAPKVLDSVQSDALGNFTFSSGDRCTTSTDFIYITVNGGYSGIYGANPNKNLVQLGVIGSCSDIATTAAANGVNVYLSEISTVAGAYTLGSFVTFDTSNDVLISAPAANYATASCSGSGASLSCTSAGLSHGFTLAAELVNSVVTTGGFPTGTANYIIGRNTASTLPFIMINTLGDVLQQCVDSKGVVTQSEISGTANDGSVCGELFEYSTTPTGQTPTSTLQAAMYLAKYPNGYPTPNLSQEVPANKCPNNAALYADCNTAAQELFNLIAPRLQPFTPMLAAAPTSYTLTIDYGLVCSSANTCVSEIPYPVDLALDYSDTVYVLFGGAETGNTYSAVDTINSSGTTITAGTQNGTYLYPTQIAVDTHGNVFVTNNDPVTATNDAILMNGSGTLTLSKVATLANASGIAVDRSSKVWASSALTSGASISQFAESTLANDGGAAPPAFTSQVMGVPVVGLAIDANQDVWGVSSATSTGISDAVLLPYSTSSASYGSAGAAGIEMSLTYGAGASVAVNSSSTAYFPLFEKLSSATYTSSAISVSASPLSTSSIQSSRSQVDGNGDVFWVDSSSGGLLYEALPSGTVAAINPCYATASGTNYQCFVSSTTGGEGSATYRSLAIDSQGNLWLAAAAPYNGGTVGAVVEVLGVGWATWPQLSYGKPGQTPQ